MKAEQDRVKSLLVDTITMLCKNGLTFFRDLKVQGLLGITVDSNDVFVVHINEILDIDSDCQRQAPAAASIHSNTHSQSFRLPMRTNSTANVFSVHSRGPKIFKTGKLKPHSSLFASGHLRRLPQTTTSNPAIPSAAPTNNAYVAPAPKITDNADDNYSLHSSSVNSRVAEASTVDTTNTFATVKCEGGDVMLIESDEESAEHEASTTMSANGDSSTTQTSTPQLLLSVKDDDQKQSSSSIVKRTDRKRIRRTDMDNGGGFSTIVNTQESATRDNDAKGFVNANDMYGYWNVNEMSGGVGGYAGGGNHDGFMDDGHNSGAVKWEAEKCDNAGQDDYFGNTSLMRPFDDVVDETYDASKPGVACQYEGCDRVFNYKRNLDRHQRDKHGAKYGAANQLCYFCTVPGCGRTFYKEFNLYKHQRESHGMETPN